MELKNCTTLEDIVKFLLKKLLLLYIKALKMVLEGINSIYFEWLLFLQFDPYKQVSYYIFVYINNVRHQIQMTFCFAFCYCYNNNTFSILTFICYKNNFKHIQKFFLKCILFDSFIFYLNYICLKFHNQNLLYVNKWNKNKTFSIFHLNVDIHNS